MSNEKIKVAFSRGPLGWGWEARGEDGTVRDTCDGYDTLADCVHAARMAGFLEPRLTQARTSDDRVMEGRLILCAQPDPADQAFLKRALTPADVYITATGAECTKALKNRVFDAYVLDYGAYDWSGPQLCREIRKTDPHAAICFYSKTTPEHGEKSAHKAAA